MNGKAAIISAIAIVGTAWLLWAGYQGMGTERREYGDTREPEGVEEPPARRDHDRARAIQQHGEILSLERILRGARARHSGRLLESELEETDGRYIYEVELVDEQGRVWEMKLDARTGEILKEAQGD
jgi:hypothetical protein